MESCLCMFYCISPYCVWALNPSLALYQTIEFLLCCSPSLYWLCEAVVVFFSDVVHQSSCFCHYFNIKALFKVCYGCNIERCFATSHTVQRNTESAVCPLRVLVLLCVCVCAGSFNFPYNFLSVPWISKIQKQSILDGVQQLQLFKETRHDFWHVFIGLGMHKSFH